ncbi:MAG: DUF1576 domain-containing protein [Treponema sp.]|nr:DUF1576 domain-containing protein [Treponema sp.]
MGNVRKLGTREYLPFTFMLAINAAFFALAFVVDRPGAVIGGFLQLIQSRAILVTDYVAIGGLGATLLNVSIVGLSTVVMLARLRLKPCGAHIMAVWLSMGFAFFGKNVFNMIPLTFGVWLYAKYRKEPFSKYYLAALLVATLSPSISEIAFLGVFSPLAEIAAGVLIGFFVGFIFPIVSAETVRVHRGFQLYNMGFSGGLTATILATLFMNLGIDIIPASYWSYGNNVFFALLLYSICAAMLAMGLFSGAGAESLKESITAALKNYRKMHQHSGRLVTDYYDLYGKSVYINLAVLCAFGTTVTLALGAQLNGPTLAGILTMMGFGSFGKHIRNVAPITTGAVLSAYVNNWDPSAPANILAILFSSGLAPIAGAFGPVWGIIAGFLHVNVANYIGDLNQGLNLYNNGFAGGLVALFLLPVIAVFKRIENFDSIK